MSGAEQSGTHHCFQSVRRLVPSGCPCRRHLPEPGQGLSLVLVPLPRPAPSCPFLPLEASGAAQARPGMPVACPGLQPASGRNLADSQQMSPAKARKGTGAHRCQPIRLRPAAQLGLGVQGPNCAAPCRACPKGPLAASCSQATSLSRNFPLGRLGVMHWRSNKSRQYEPLRLRHPTLRSRYPCGRWPAAGRLHAGTVSPGNHEISMARSRARGRDAVFAVVCNYF